MRGGCDAQAREAASEKGEVLLRGVCTLRYSVPQSASVQWQPDGSTIRTNKWFLGAGFLGAPPISLNTAVHRAIPYHDTSRHAYVYTYIYIYICISLSLSLSLYIYIYICLRPRLGDSLGVAPGRVLPEALEALSVPAVKSFT